MLQAAAGSTMDHITCPPRMNATAEATLEATFATLAEPEAVTMSMCSRAVKAIISRVPVPGPTMPS